jgi:hypothetical protein
MSRPALLLSAVALLAAIATPAEAQVPQISKRTFSDGTAKLKVTGTFSLDEEIGINRQASIADEGQTWLQYGSSGSDSANVLVTVQPYEVGISPGKGKQNATAGADNCKGKLVVTAALVTGNYKCTGVTSYDQKTRKMGKVDIEISFTANTAL